MQDNNRVFTCQMCGQCCIGEGGIVLSSTDISRLCTGLDLGREKFKSRYTVQKSGKAMLKSSNGCCLFFSRNQGCLVHQLKPDICRAWPFFKGNLQDIQSWRLAQDYCPGIKPETGHQEFIKQGLNFLKENSLLYSKQDPDAPAALLKLNEIP